MKHDLTNLKHRYIDTKIWCKYHEQTCLTIGIVVLLVATVVVCLVVGR